MKEAFDLIRKRLEKLLGDTNFEKATQKVNESFYDGLAYAYGEALSIVSEVEAEYINKSTEHINKLNNWIPCSERLPDNNRIVLCYAESLARGADEMFVGSCDNGFWFLQSSIGTESYPTQYKVLAWMPVPELYRRESE